LKKCLSVGMKIEMLRASITRRPKTTQHFSFAQVEFEIKQEKKTTKF